MSTLGTERPSSTASSMSNADTDMRRRNSGEKRKLSAENTCVAMSFSASRCLSTGTGVSGSRPEPARSRSVVRPPMYFAA